MTLKECEGSLTCTVGCGHARSRVLWGVVMPDHVYCGVWSCPITCTVGVVMPDHVYCGCVVMPDHVYCGCVVMPDHVYCGVWSCPITCTVGVWSCPIMCRAHFFTALVGR